MTNTPPFSIRPEQPDDAPAIDALNDLAFGPGRYTRTAYRLREGVPHEPNLAFVGEVDGDLIGSVRLTRITVGDRDVLLLGPLAVAPAWKDKGCGKSLVRTATKAARADGHRLVLLVGDEPYYGPLGFRRVEPLGAVTLPGPVDPTRILVSELVPDAAAGLSGQARQAR
jgi:predicted N-acetyltransferase YhbS